MKKGSAGILKVADETDCGGCGPKHCSGRSETRASEGERGGRMPGAVACLKLEKRIISAEDSQPLGVLIPLAQ